MNGRRHRHKRTQRKPKRLLNICDRDLEVWRNAVFKLRNQLFNDCVTLPTEKLRFQNGRLIEDLRHAIRDRENEIDVRECAFRCYWLVKFKICELGYNEAWQLHLAEMRARGLSDWSRLGQHVAKIDELNLRLDSIASWLEAHEAFIFWRFFNDNHQLWDRNDSSARKRAMMAQTLADLPQKSRLLSELWLGKGVSIAHEWNPKQWASILRAAARLAEKPQDYCSLLEKWVWWLYPIFYRYHWNAREVLELAKAKFNQVEKWSADQFQRYWIKRGLRFTGKKTNRASPPLAELVTNAPIPQNVSLDYAMWYPIAYQKSYTSR